MRWNALATRELLYLPLHNDSSSRLEPIRHTHTHSKVSFVVRAERSRTTRMLRYIFYTAFRMAHSRCLALVYTIYLYIRRKCVSHSVNLFLNNKYIYTPACYKSSDPDDLRTRTIDYCVHEKQPFIINETKII